MKNVMISFLFIFILASCGTESEPDIDPPTQEPPSQPEPEADTRAQYTVTLTLSNTISEIELRFGQHSNPSSQDEQMPPAPPEGTLHAYFTKDSNDYWRDFRSEDSEEEEWDFTFQTGDNGPAVLKWNLQSTRFPGSLTLLDLGDDSIVDIEGTGEIDIPGSTEGTFIFEYKLK